MNIASIQAMVSCTAAEKASGQISTNMSAVGRLDAERKTNEKVMKNKEVELEGLAEQIEAINRRDGVEKFFLGIFGDDCGAGRVTDGMGRATAELKRAQGNVEIQNAKIEQLLEALSGTQDELGKKLEQHSQVYREQQNALELGEI